jgi:hypothetical protein
MLRNKTDEVTNPATGPATAHRTAAPIGGNPCSIPTHAGHAWDGGGEAEPDAVQGT